MGVEDFNRDPISSLELKVLSKDLHLPFAHCAKEITDSSEFGIHPNLLLEPVKGPEGLKRKTDIDLRGELSPDPSGASAGRAFT